MSSEDSEDADYERRCQFHEDRRAIARGTSTSAVGTPIVSDMCRECFRQQLDGFSMFGGGFDEVEVFDEEAEAILEEYR